MIDELEVKTRHKKKLAKIRQDKADVYNRDGNSGRYDEVGYGKVPDAQRENGEADRSSGAIEQGTESEQGIARRYDSRGGSANTTYLDSTESAYSGNREAGSTGGVKSPSAIEIEAEETPEEKALRERELTRQRQQRYRNKQKEELEAQTSSNIVTLRDTKNNGDVTFKLKNPFDKSNDSNAKDEEPSKPLTNKESDEHRDKLIFLYQRGSELLDDLLEVIVKDHEPVQIWRLDDEEAELLANLQLERAKKDANTARIVRKLVAIHDRLFIAFLVGPKCKATFSHVKTHQGFSFR